MGIPKINYRDDSHTVNTVTGFIIDNIPSSSNDNMSIVTSASGPYTWKSTISVLHVDGTEEVLDTDVAVCTRSSTGSGLQSATWSCPQTELVTTDAIKIVEKIYDGSNSLLDSTTFISSQLNWNELSAATWTLNKYTSYSSSIFNTIRLRWGGPVYRSGVSNVDYNLPTGVSDKYIALKGDYSDHGGIIFNHNQFPKANFYTNGINVALDQAMHVCPISGHGTTPITAVTTKSYKEGKLILTRGAVAECGAVMVPANRKVTVE